MRITADNSIGLVIDIQERLYPVMHNKEVLAHNTAKLLQGLRILNIPVLVTQQYSKGLGNTIGEVAQHIEHFGFTEKMSFSCCDEVLFVNKINELKRKQIIICGIEAHVCVLQTVIDLKEKGFIPVVVTDCVSSRKEEDKNTAIERMRFEGAILTSYESILFELCRYADTEGFKAISKLVK